MTTMLNFFCTIAVFKKLTKYIYLNFCLPMRLRLALFLKILSFLFNQIQNYLSQMKMAIESDCCLFTPFILAEKIFNFYNVYVIFTLMHYLKFGVLGKQFFKQKNSYFSTMPRYLNQSEAIKIDVMININYQLNFLLIIN